MMGGRSVSQETTRKQQAELTKQWDGEKSKLQLIQSLKEEARDRSKRCALPTRACNSPTPCARTAHNPTRPLQVDAVQKDVERAERTYDLNRAAELKCVLYMPPRRSRDFTVCTPLLDGASISAS